MTLLITKPNILVQLISEIGKLDFAPIHLLVGGGQNLWQDGNGAEGNGVITFFGW